MAFTSFAVGRVRTGGNAANGAFYDSSLAGVGSVDYTQQDAAQASWTTSLAMAGTTNLADSGANGLFTAAMVGNAVLVNSLYYFIVAFVDVDNVTVDRSDTFAAKSGKVGGAAAILATLANAANATHAKVIAGNTIYVRGSGVDVPTVDDYATTGSYAIVTGNNASPSDIGGHVKIIGENGRPRLSSNGKMFTGGSYVWLENLYLTATGNTSGTTGMVQLSSNANLRNCYIDLANQSGLTGVRLSDLGVIDDCIIFSATGTPVASANCDGIFLSGYACEITDCTIVRCRTGGILANNAVQVKNCIIYNNAGDGIALASGVLAANVVEWCDIAYNAGHGIRIDANTALNQATIRNNNIVFQSGASKYGININDGATAINDFLKRFVDYNNFFGNTANYNALSAGAHDTAVNPGYTSAATLDFSTGEAMAGLGWPGTYRGSQTTSTPRPGVWQAAATSVDLHKILRKVIAIAHDISLLRQKG